LQQACKTKIFFKRYFWNQNIGWKISKFLYIL